MATINDATVASTAYDTSGNGGRKLIRLNNTKLAAAVKTSTGYLIYASSDNGLTWTNVFQQTNFTSFTDISLVAVGDKIGVLYSYNGGYVRFVLFNADGTKAQVETTVDTGQEAVGNVSLAINEAGTELHAAWASKNSSFGFSFNIRYAKGTFNADGSVTWGAVAQKTTINASPRNNQNPAITLNKDGTPIVTFESYDGGTYKIVALGVGNSTLTYINGSHSVVYDGGTTYGQYSPSAIFVPQSVNGLANGRIWVAWDGTDSANTTQYNVKLSYSDDGGVTWSTMQKLTNESANACRYPSITASESGEVSVLFAHNGNGVKQTDYNNGTWSAVKSVATPAGVTWAYPAALGDPTVRYTEPLFIYNGANKVGFYGAWSTTEISVAPGHLGTKTDRANVLTYAITTDGTMSTITEKVNGVTIGTKTATSGQSLIAGLTQAQWDAVRFGKYADATGGKNTLTVTMGDDVFTYTFDKRPATDADILTATKAIKDSQEAFLPSVKLKLVGKVGGNTTDTFEKIIDDIQVGVVGGKRWASGTTTSTSGTRTVVASSGSSYSQNFIDVTGLSFTPKSVTLYYGAQWVGNVVTYEESLKIGEYFYVRTNTGDARVGGNVVLAEGRFSLPVNYASTPIYWVAYE